MADDPPLDDAFFDGLFNSLPPEKAEDSDKYGEFTERLLGGKGWHERSLNGVKYKVAPLDGSSPLYKDRSLAYFYEDLARHRGSITDVEKELFQYAITRAARSFSRHPASKYHAAVLTLGTMPTGSRVMCLYAFPRKDELPADGRTNPPLDVMLRVLGMDQAYTLPATVEAIGFITGGKAFGDHIPTAEEVASGNNTIMICVSLDTQFTIPPEYKQNDENGGEYDSRPDPPKELVLQYLRMGVASCLKDDAADTLEMGEFMEPEAFIENPRPDVDMFLERAQIAGDLLNLLAGWQFQIMKEGGPRKWAAACMARLHNQMSGGHDDGSMFGRGEMFRNMQNDIMRHLRDKLDQDDEEDDGESWKK